ncbi:MAG: carbonic anhydrase [Promethearchaeota archaeon]
MNKDIEQMLINGNFKYQQKILQDIECLNIKDKIPKYPILILTCMDPRIDIYRIFQLNPGDVFILRNAGNQYTKDVLRSILIAIHEHNVKYLIILGHLDCRMTKINLNNLRRKLHILNGKYTSQYGQNLIYEIRDFFKPFTDEIRNLNKQIEIFQNLRDLPKDIQITGMLYDVNTGWVFEHKKFKAFISIESFMNIFKENMKNKHFELNDFLESNDYKIIDSGKSEQEIDTLASTNSISKENKIENRIEEKVEIDSNKIIDQIDICNIKEITYQKIRAIIKIPDVRIPKIRYPKINIYIPSIKRNQNE